MCDIIGQFVMIFSNNFSCSDHSFYVIEWLLYHMVAVKSANPAWRLDPQICHVDLIYNTDQLMFFFLSCFQVCSYGRES